MEELKDQLNDLLEIAKHAASEAGQFLVSCPPESRFVEKHLLRDSKILADRESEKIILDVSECRWSTSMIRMKLVANQLGLAI